MGYEKKTTALNSAVSAAAEQSQSNMYAESITDSRQEINEGFALGLIASPPGMEEQYPNEDMQRILRLMYDPGYLPTMSMVQLYDQVYQARPPLIDNLLYPGTYLFVGAPKLGKSFLMLQIAYHVATGMPLWEYGVRQSTVLYLALEDDPRRLGILK